MSVTHQIETSNRELRLWIWEPCFESVEFVIEGYRLAEGIELPETSNEGSPPEDLGLTPRLSSSSFNFCVKSIMWLHLSATRLIVTNELVICYRQDKTSWELLFTSQDWK